MPHSYSTHCKSCPYINGNHLPGEIRSIRSQPLSIECNNSKVLLIFQAPGIEEWKSGKPISSLKPNSAGAKLAAAFQLLGKNRFDYDITNVVQCFPGKKDPTDVKRPRDKRPPMGVQNHCSKWLREDISRSKYDRIIVYGIPAKNAVEKMGFKTDSRFVFVPHPTAPGVAIATLAKSAA